MTSVIHLSLEEVRVCTLLATERWFTKKGSIDKPGYAMGKRFGALEHELLANIRANVAEYAVSKYYALPWTMPWYPNEEHKNRKDHPDVGSNIEVRVVRTKPAIAIWEKDINKDAVIIGCKVLDDDYFTQVEIYGWYRAREAKRVEWFDKPINGYRIPITEFKEGHGETE